MFRRDLLLRSSFLGFFTPIHGIGNHGTGNLPLPSVQKKSHEKIRSHTISLPKVYPFKAAESGEFFDFDIGSKDPELHKAMVQGDVKKILHLLATGLEEESLTVHGLHGGLGELLKKSRIAPMERVLPPLINSSLWGMEASHKMKDWMRGHPEYPQNKVASLVEKKHKILLQREKKWLSLEKQLHGLEEGRAPNTLKKALLEKAPPSPIFSHALYKALGEKPQDRDYILWLLDHEKLSRRDFELTVDPFHRGNREGNYTHLRPFLQNILDSKKITQRALHNLLDAAAMFQDHAGDFIAMKGLIPRVNFSSKHTDMTHLQECLKNNIKYGSMEEVESLLGMINHGIEAMAERYQKYRARRHLAPFFASCASWKRLKVKGFKDLKGS